MKYGAPCFPFTSRYEIWRARIRVAEYPEVRFAISCECGIGILRAEIYFEICVRGEVSSGPRRRNSASVPLHARADRSGAGWVPTSDLAARPRRVGLAECGLAPYFQWRPMLTVGLKNNANLNFEVKCLAVLLNFRPCSMAQLHTTLREECNWLR